MKLRALAAALIGLLVVLVGPGIHGAEAADAQFVISAVRTLEAHYVDPLGTPTLLNAALESLQTQFHVEPLGGPIPDGASAADASRLFTQRFDEIASQEGGRASATQLAYAAVSGMLASLHDSHTAFIPPAAYQEQQRREDGAAAFVGIGIETLYRDGQVYVDEVYPESPAETAGVQPFDRIVAVNGQTVAAMDDDGVSTTIRGADGTPVVLTVMRAGQAASVDIRIMRAPIRVPRVSSRLLDGGIGYVRIYEFVPGTGGAFRNAIFGLRRQGMRAMVLDLRGNPGGLVDELRDVSAAMLPQRSPIVKMRTRSGREEMLDTSDPPIVPADTPIAVLVDEDTGSAAELLSAALQEQSRAVIVGTRTAGAVEIGITVHLPEGAGMAITVARVWSGKGTRLEGSGVTPDALVTLTTDAMNLGHDSQLDKAVQVVRDKLAAASWTRPAPLWAAQAA